MRTLRGSTTRERINDPLWPPIIYSTVTQHDHKYCALRRRPTVLALLQSTLKFHSIEAINATTFSRPLNVPKDLDHVQHYQIIVTPPQLSSLSQGTHKY